VLAPAFIFTASPGAPPIPTQLLGVAEANSMQNDTWYGFRGSSVKSNR
jgi:hypothetical protein